MADKPAPYERRANPAASALPDEKEEILRLIEDLGGDPALSEFLKQKFLHFALGEDQKFALISSLYENARRDERTGLPSVSDLRWGVIERLEMEHRDNAFAVAYFDAREFKRINDNISHEVGDKIIVRIARVLSSEMRSQDTKVRLGLGDEFGGAIFLDTDDQPPTETDDLGILRIIERCCLAFEQTSWVDEYKEWREAVATKPELVDLKPTLNVGVIIVHAGQGPRIKSGSGKVIYQKILKMAERMMYKSKTYEKNYGSRRIFYQIVGFEGQKLKVLAHKFFDSPIVG